MTVLQKPYFLVDTPVSLTTFFGEGIVTYEEFVQGALAVIRQAETKRQSTVPGYLLLTRQIEFLASFPVLEFDATAESLFADFPPELRRAGNRDCKIAACALRHGATVITQNLRHFSLVPELRCLDWTQTTGRFQTGA